MEFAPPYTGEYYVSAGLVDAEGNGGTLKKISSKKKEEISSKFALENFLFRNRPPFIGLLPWGCSEWPFCFFFGVNNIGLISAENEAEKLMPHLASLHGSVSLSAVFDFFAVFSRIFPAPQLNFL